MNITRIELLGCQSPETIGKKSVERVQDVEKHFIDAENVTKLEGILQTGLKFADGEDVVWGYPAQIKQVLGEAFDGSHTGMVAELYDWLTTATQKGVDIIAVKLIKAS